MRRAVIAGSLVMFGMAGNFISVRVFAEPSPAAANPLIASGKRIYQAGRLIDGTPLQAMVVGDVSLKGDKIACVSCHRRSGLGTVEGKILTPAITGDLLYRPKKTAKYQRSAYTDETLSRAIREGVDLAGRTLVPLMPHYVLDDENMRALIAYLKTLSTKAAPGVTDDTIHFATVVTDEVKLENRKAMLDVLDRFIKDKNSGTRQETIRAKARTANVKKNHYTSYRKWTLSTWELTGPPDTWRIQLENHYRQRPVFALLSGISTHSWQPVHRFCEDFAIPCLLPITDLPTVTASDFYTLYFSRGLALEAEIVAKFLGDQIGAGYGKRIVQVYRGDESGLLMSRTFRGAWEKQGRASPEDHVFAHDQKFTGGFWNRFVSRVKPSVLLLWLSHDDLVGLDGLNEKTSGAPETIYLSNSFLGDNPLSFPQATRKKIHISYPYSLPRSDKPQFLREESWLRLKKLDSGDKTIKAKTVFACAVAGEALMHIENIFSREYILERIEHMLDSSALTSIYPQVSLGPDQRFVAKGAYVVKLTDTPNTLAPVGGWIIP